MNSNPITLSTKLSSVCDALAFHADKGGLDPVFLLSLRAVLEDCVDRARTIERGIVPPLQLGPVDCHAVAALARLHLTQQRALQPDEVLALACVAVVHEAATCAPRGKREVRS